jgi:hypothetical protein
VTLAYLDPGSGSMIVSAVVGGVAAVGVAATQVRNKFSGLGRKRQRSDEPQAEVETPADAEASPQDEASRVSSET